MTIFSIIIPLYNCENLIDRALKSCQNQDFEKYEVLIIDDKSEDKSAKIALEFAKKISVLSFFKMFHIWELLQVEMRAL